MEIVRNVYRNNKFEGVYTLIKHEDVYLWRLDRYSYEKNHTDLHITRLVDTIKLPRRAFPFEEGDI